MRINLEEYCSYVRYTLHEVDPEKYFEWLEGDKPTSDNLIEYINETWDPVEEYDDNYDSEGSEFQDMDEVNRLFKAMKGYTYIPKPTIF